MGVWSILAHWVVSSTLQTGVVVTLLSLITRIAWRHLSPRWGAALWILVLMRLAVPWSPSGWLLVAVGADTVLPRWVSHLSNSVDAAALPGASSGGATDHLSHAAIIHWPLVAVTIWGLGALVFALRSLHGERRFRRAVAQARERTNLPVMSTALRIDVRETSAVRAPAAFGLRRPQILIPPGLVDRLTPEQWQWVVQHEWHHIRRFDIAARWAMELATILYWFNPFVWIARRELRAAQELAADEGVIRSLSPEDRLEYGRVLLAVATYEGSGVPSVAGMKLQRSSLARRIERIHQTPHRALARGTTASAVVLTVVLTLSAAAVAAGGRSPSFPPGFGNQPQAQSSTVSAGSSPGTIHAATFAQAVRTSLADQIQASDRNANVVRELSHVIISAIHTIHNTYTAQVLVPFHGHLFMGTLVAERQGTRWIFASPADTSLGWVDPQRPLNVMETGGQITPTGTPYFLVAGIARPGIQYVVIHLSSGATVRVDVSPSHTFTYLTDAQQGTRGIDAYSASHHRVYRW